MNGNNNQNISEHMHAEAIQQVKLSIREYKTMEKFVAQTAKKGEIIFTILTVMANQNSNSQPRLIQPGGFE